MIVINDSHQYAVLFSTDFPDTALELPTSFAVANLYDNTYVVEEIKKARTICRSTAILGTVLIAFDRADSVYNIVGMTGVNGHRGKRARKAVIMWFDIDVELKSERGSLKSGSFVHHY